MKAFYVSTLLLLASSQVIFSQSHKNLPDFEPHRNLRMDLSIAMGKGINVNSLQVSKFRWLDKKESFSLGYGLRLTNSNFSNLKMSYSPQNKSEFESFTASGFAVSLNFMVSAEYTWQNKLSFGASTDLFGLSMGGDRVSEAFVFKPGPRPDLPNAAPYGQGADVQDINIRNSFKNPGGILNSELYASYKLSRKYWIRFGYASHYNEVALKKSKETFSHMSHLIFAGIRIRY